MSALQEIAIDLEAERTVELDEDSTTSKIRFGALGNWFAGLSIGRKITWFFGVNPSHVFSFLQAPYYDAYLHTIFIGFTFSMIFGHAPIIFPGILKISITFNRRFYLHLFLLQNLPTR